MDLEGLRNPDGPRIPEGEYCMEVPPEAKGSVGCLLLEGEADSELGLCLGEEAEIHEDEEELEDDNIEDGDEHELVDAKEIEYDDEDVVKLMVEDEFEKRPADDEDEMLLGLNEAVPDGTNTVGRACQCLSNRTIMSCASRSARTSFLDSSGREIAALSVIIPLERINTSCSICNYPSGK